jgi:signal transduction histidine kinase
LGMLTAGIAHEINNPVAAVQRGTGHLKKAIEQYDNAKTQLEQLDLTVEQLGLLHSYLSTERESSQRNSDWDVIARSDQVSELGDWLEDHQIDDSWDLAPALVDMGFNAPDLDRLVEAFEKSQFPCVVSWLAARSNLFNIVDEIRLGATRVSEIVTALKSYVYLDQGPVQKIDLHEGLENTLIILHSKIGDGIRLRREYSPDVPRISAYGSELNQVWTNIIANAAEAMQGQGEIILRTRYDNDWVIVDSR